jgi:hypothetical protein
MVFVRNQEKRGLFFSHGPPHTTRPLITFILNPNKAGVREGNYRKISCISINKGKS